MVENNDECTMKNNNLFHKLKSMPIKKKVITIILVLTLFVICGLVGCYITYSKHINLAKISFKNENFDEAIYNYKLAEKYNLEYDSDNDIIDVTNIKNSKLSYKIGIEEFKDKDYVRAVNQLRSVIAKDKKRYSDALKKIKVCENEITKSNLDLAKKSMQQQKYEESMEYLDVAMTMQPDNSEVKQLYSQCKGVIDKTKADADAKAKAEQDAQDAKAKAEQEAKDAKALEEAKAKAKTEGVKIGMTQQQVLDSSWGKPDQINKTTSAYGTREQWVYGYNSSKMNCLYFENGILTDIQN